MKMPSLTRGAKEVLIGVNIASMKPTQQRPATYFDLRKQDIPYFYNASLAVDGNTSEDFVDGSCSSTTGNDGKEVSWTVFLQNAYNITGIRIYNRKEVKIRLKNFIVYGDSLLIHDSYGTRENFKSVIDIPLDGTRSFSSIKILLPVDHRYSDEGKVYLSLCEVQVYAEACHVIESPQNGNVLHPLLIYTIGKQMIVTCNTGYEPKTTTINCQRGGHWSIPFPACYPVHCPSLRKPDNGHYQIYNREMVNNYWQPFPFRTVIIGVCDLGYEGNYPSYRTCQSDKTWNGIELLCNPILCPHPRNISNGFYELQNGTKVYSANMLHYNSIIKASCNEGYTLSRQPERTCERDKTWSGEDSQCNIVTCELPEGFTHGHYAINDQIITRNNKFPSLFNEKLNFSSKINVVCVRGYTLTSGNVFRQCNSTGFWTGENPECSLVTCKWPLYIENGCYKASRNATRDGMLYNTTLTATCDDTYKLFDKYRTRRCNEEAVWDKDPALCKPLCRVPNITNGHFVNVASVTEIEAGSSLQLSCNPGFTHVTDSKAITCLQNHLWSIHPDCVANAEAQKSSRAGLIGGLTAAFVLVTVVSALVFFFYRRRIRYKDQTETPMQYKQIKKKENESNRSTDTHVYEYSNVREIDFDTMDTKEERPTRVVLPRNAASSRQSAVYSDVKPEQVVPSIASSSSLQSDQAYYSFSATEKIPATAVKLTDLSDLIFTGADAKEMFRKQFQSLPHGMVEAHMEALKPQNRGKNRYKYLYAYDDTRVVLETENEPLSDYINACFVHGFNKTRKYIASQGPTEDILDDFWRMIWQTDCCKIVMLTNLKEEGKVKCERYWPHHGSNTYGRIVVTIKNVELFSQFVIRTLTIRKDDSPERTVTQFHFTDWPDRGVPKYASSIVQFLSKVKYAPSYGKGPIVVHCSAGVGRTGTFIAIDNVTEQGKVMGYIDVAGVVEAMRKQRVSSVQTLDQYIFVYQAVTEALMLSTAAIPAAEFQEAFQELLQTDTKKKKRKICLEFEALKKMSPVAEENEYVSSKLVRNRRKNRYSNVLPIEEFMPTLTKGDGSEDAEYINAVFLPSYKEKKAFIITQTPLESTREAFWRLIWEHDIRTLIMMNSREEMTKSEVYWPNDGGTVTFGNIVIMNDSAEERNTHNVISLFVKNFMVTRWVTLIQCGGWKSRKSLPESHDVVLSVMELVQSIQQQTGNHTVLVHCMNGVDKSGLFCVTSAVIERMKIEQDVAIPHVIEVMRNAREQIIPSVEQYQFCHETVLAFIHQYDTYSNFAA